MVRASLILCALLAGCAGGVRTVEVKVPVAQRIEPPAGLLAPIAGPKAAFVAPGTDGAVACLAPAGRDDLIGYVDQLRQRLEAWEAWAR